MREIANESADICLGHDDIFVGYWV
jgi:hypothetical protein